MSTTPPLPSTPVYIIIWEYRPNPEHRAAFEAAYSETGDWVQFFQQGEGYLGTRLYHDTDTEGRYMTIDMWTSEAAYSHFRETHRADYVALDDRFEPLTIYERRIGAFFTVI
jgi:quinol monooxygenase YgiN